MVLYLKQTPDGVIKASYKNGKKYLTFSKDNTPSTAKINTFLIELATSFPFGEKIEINVGAGEGLDYMHVIELFRAFAAAYNEEGGE